MAKKAEEKPIDKNRENGAPADGELEVEETPVGEVPEAEISQPAETDAADDPRDEVLKRLNEAEERAQANEDRYLRTVADLENFRRRAARERDELREIAVAGVIEDLLPAMDNLRLGLQAADNHPEAEDVAAGFRMVADQLRKTLESYGLEEISPDGGEFDPNLHDCMSHQPHDELAEGVVIQTVRPGYRLRKRLLRAASVVVSSGAPESGDHKET